MKNEIIQRIASVVNALNNIYVKGEENLANLSGSITVLRETLTILSRAEILEEPKEVNREGVK